MKPRTLNLLLLALLAVLICAPWVRARWDARSSGIPPAPEFRGADEEARSLITQIRPGYRPWFSPLWQPPSRRAEVLLFALQATAGAAAIGLCLVLLSRRSRAGQAPRSG